MNIYLYIIQLSGLLPSFLTSDIVTGIQPDIPLTDYYPQTHNDAALITWAHSTNDYGTLKSAMKSDVMMIGGDVLLRGQGTEHQEMIPVMAYQSQADSTVTFTEWLQTVSKSGKGIKIDFKSIECVELCLQTLNHADPPVSTSIRHIVIIPLA